MNTCGRVGGVANQLVTLQRGVLASSVVSSFGRGSPSVLDGEDSVFPNTWMFNQRWSLERAEGFKFETLENGEFLECGFETERRVDAKYKQTVFARVIGAKPSSYYEMNGFNCRAALSRLFKAQTLKNDAGVEIRNLDYDNELFHNQLSLLDALPDRGANALSGCGARIGSVLEFMNPFLTDSKILVTGPNDAAFHVVFRKMKQFSKGKKVQRWAGVKPLCRGMKCMISAFIQRFNSEMVSDLRQDLIKCGVTMYHANGTRSVVQVASTVVDLVYTPGYWAYDKLLYLGAVVDLPTPKKSLYQQWYNDTAILTKIMENEGEWELKLKKEPGKYKKAPRLFGSGDQLCLVDKISPEVVKSGTHGWMHLHEMFPNGENLRFSISFENANSPAVADALMQYLYNDAPNGIYCVYFSDDGFILVKEGGVLRYETDISGCDASNGVAVFAIVYWILRMVSCHETAMGLVSQCGRRATLSNPSNRDERVVFRPMGFFEFSGSLLTTILNNVASFCIFCAIYLAVIDGQEMGNAIVTATRAYGWILTVDKREQSSQLTFLKRCYDAKSQRTFPCAGIMIRTLGIVEGTPTAESFGLPKGAHLSEYTAEELLEILIKTRVDGWVHEAGSSLLNAFRKRCRMEPLDVVIGDDAFITRYGFATGELEELCIAIEELQVGDLVQCGASIKIMMVDYGVSA